jgi:hypothetical protein
LDVRFTVYQRVARLDFAQIHRVFYSPNYYGSFSIVTASIVFNGDAGCLPCAS